MLTATGVDVIYILDAVLVVTSSSRVYEKILFGAK